MTNFNFIREISSYVKFANTVNTVKPVNTVNTVNTIYTVNTVNEVNVVNSVNTLNTVNTINTADTVNTSKPSASSGRFSSIFLKLFLTCTCYIQATLANLRRGGRRRGRHSWPRSQPINWCRPLGIKVQYFGPLTQPNLFESFPTWNSRLHQGQ